MLMIISLVLKHWMAFFLGWLVMWTPFGTFRRRLAFVGITAGAFVLHFIPYAFDEAARYGMIHTVFLHRPGPADSFISKIFKYGSPAEVYEVVQTYRVVSLLWVGALGAVGWSLRRASDGRYLPLIYLITLVAFSPHWADVYFGGPLIACAVYHRLPAAWLYALSTTVMLLASPHNVGSTLESHPVIESVVRVLHRGDFQQLVLFFLLYGALRRVPRQEPTRGVVTLP
jgi:hypothetical protein